MKGDGERRHTDERRGRVRFGRMAETLAVFTLILSGWRIIRRRWRAAGGEVDIAATRAGVLAIIEVKARQTERAALEALGQPQRQRIVRAARALLASNPALAAYDLRFDVIVVRPWAWPRRIPAAFNETGH